MIICEICSIKLSGPKDHAAHIAGQRHRSKVESLRPNQSAPSNPPRQPTYFSGGQQHPTAHRATRPAHSNPRPQGSNPADPPRPPHVPHPNARLGGPRRPAGQSSGSVSQSHFPRAAGTRPSQPRRPQAATSAPPSESNNPPSKTKAPKRPPPPRREYDVDFKVIRNTDRGMRWEFFDVVSELGHVGEPTVSIVPIKPSRKASVEGFSWRKPTPSPSGRGYRIEFGFNPAAVGRGVHIVEVQLTYPFNSGDAPRSLKLKAILGSPEDHEDLKPTEDFQPPDEDDLKDDWQRGEMLWDKQTQSTPAADFERLPHYNVPNGFWKEAQKFVGREVLAVTHLQSLLPAPTFFRSNTYAEHWTQLLWHEEIAMSNQLKQYDMSEVPIRQLQANKHSLKVPGLEEKRPSVIVSDLIAIRKPDLGEPIYGGSVTEVQKSEVILQLHREFPSVRGQLWDTRFTVNRLVLRRMHDAVRKASADSDRILFPKSSHQKSRITPLPRLSLDRHIGSNDRQRLAVEQIISLSPGDIPFIIFGPPGTGKTTVVVEAIHQVLQIHQESRLLVCAPSNSAADLLAVRLATTYTPRQLLRLNAPSRPYDALPVTLRKYSTLEGKTFTAPSMDDLMKFKIVVSTCSSASIPRALRIKDHFTHIFIDEAGHASEPEIMIPILQNASRETNIILSGDPKQLGPIVQSKPCEKLGMAKSLLDRLIQRPVYDIKSGSASTLSIVKLLQNYRSHPAILHWPNQVFYEGELEPCADPIVTTQLTQFHKLPQPGFPIIFHSICGENQREGKSPSYFNIDEATLVRYYVNALLEEGNYGLSAKHIGVIAPYRQQCVKIRELLNRDGFGGVGVGVTEDWQGQEKRVIIISTVRSDPELLEEGALRFKFLGFVTSQTRMNVALTRAQALMIVIGNGPILKLDPYWSSFIRFVYNSGGCEGDDLFFTESYDHDTFEEMRMANQEYIRKIGTDGHWDILKNASDAWNPSN